MISVGAEGVLDLQSYPTFMRDSGDYRQRMREVHGWFGVQDFDLFEWFLSRQSGGPPGDLLEMGAYLGRSAILLGYYVRAREALVVCDLFGAGSGDPTNDVENVSYAANLGRRRFEHNYTAFHGALPRIVQGPTSSLPAELVADGARFVHVDASHLYEHVAQDLRTAQVLLRHDGIVVCDDYRSTHTPGTAAAVWEAAADGRLNPICVSKQKLYGTFGDPRSHQEALVAAPPANQRIETQRVLGADLLVLRPLRPRRRADRLLSRVDRLPRRLGRAVAREALRRTIVKWALDEPLIAAEASSRTGVDILLMEAKPVRRSDGSSWA